MKTRGRPLAVGFLALTLLAAGCGDDDSDDTPTANSEAPTQNACPADGCQISIADVARDGEELLVSFQANFLPDVSNNHIHIYWDTYTAGQVSNDAEARGLTQGSWVPTDSYPDFVTQDAVSVTAADGSTTLCVTTGDRDHNTIDDETFDCRDVGDLLSS